MQKCTSYLYTSRKPINSVTREVFYKMLIDILIPMKLVRLIKMCMTEMYSRVRVGKRLSNVSIETFEATEFN